MDAEIRQNTNEARDTKYTNVLADVEQTRAVRASYCRIKTVLHMYKGRPVLRSVNLASRFKALPRVPAPATSLYCRFLYFSP